MAHAFIEDVVEQQQWLEPTGETLHRAVGKIARREGPSRTVKDMLHGVWLGHPLHPALTDLPVGSWSASLVLDLMSLRGNRFIQQGADAALGVGLVGAAASALTGLADWQETYGRKRRIGLLHGLLNAAAASLYTASFVQRRRQRRGMGILLSSLGYATVLVSAYLGGELVFGQGTGVNHAAWLEASEAFTPVMDEAALQADRPVRVMAGNTPVMLVRRGQKIYALTAVCTHAGGPLDEGTLEDNSIVCPWHGSIFSLEDGSVQGGPATMDEQPWDVRVRDGKIEVRRTERRV